MLHDQRLRHREDFKRILAAGRTKSDSRLVLKTLVGTGAPSRFGIVTSKKVGGAVVRNRVRRRIREILRGQEIAPGTDLVFIARAPAAEAPFTDLESSVKGLLKRAGLYGTTDEKISPRTDQALPK
jgi:ribonuclease P protein component